MPDEKKPDDTAARQAIEKVVGTPSKRVSPQLFKDLYRHGGTGVSEKNDLDQVTMPATSMHKTQHGSKMIHAGGKRKLRRVMPDDQIVLKGGERFVVRKKRVLHDVIMTEDARPGKIIRELQKKTGKKPQKDGWGLYDTLFHRMTLNVRLAHKFVLDDHAVETVCEAASTSDTNKIEGMLMMARLPFDKVWVEYDLAVRNDYYVKHGSLVDRFKQDEAECGFLLQRVHPDDPTTWSALFVVLTEYGVDFGGVGYLFRTEGDPLPFALYEGDELRHREALKYHDMGIVGSADGGETSKALHGVPWGLTTDRISHQTYGVSERMYDHCRVVMPAIAYAFSDETEKNAQHFVEAAKEGRGDARWLVALLSLINRVPIRYVARDNVPGNRLVGTRVVKYMQHSTMKLDLDGREAVRQVHDFRHPLGYQRQSPVNHPVRGHWMRWPNTGRASCRHIAWPSAELREELTAGYILCEKCTALLTWKDDYRAGDAGRGYKELDYEVTAGG